MTSKLDTFTLPPTAAGRQRRRRRWIGLLTAAVVLTAGVVWVTTVVVRSCGSPWSGVVEIEGECVGVTDGSYVFHPELAEIQQKIAEENARVSAGSAPYVTIALLDPLTPGSMSGLPPAQVRNRLEGAYTALRRVNTTPVAGDPSNPEIQLLLANEGSTNAQWPRVIDQLIELSERPDNPLVAVIGLGISTKATERRALQLSQKGIPMVGSILTADGLSYENITGLIKTSPSNRHYVEALDGYVKNAEINSAIIVRDSNSDNGLDLFTKTLTEEFEGQMSGLAKEFETLQFPGSAIPENTNSQLFSNVTTNICSAANKGLQAILYAGREVDLGSFLESLEHRLCRTTPLTILTAGSDLAAVLGPWEPKLSGMNLTIVFAGTVDAEGWRRNVPGTPERFRDFQQEFEAEQRFDPEHLNDGGAIMMHDALLTAAKAVRLASVSSPTASDVFGQLLNLSTEFAVPGASGTVSFSFRSPGAGEPVGKPVPVLQYPKPTDSPYRQVGPPYEVS